MKKNELVSRMIAELRFNFDEYDDGCNEVNYTLLAEEFARKYDLYGKKKHEIPEWVFDVAIEAADKFNKKVA